MPEELSSSSDLHPRSIHRAEALLVPFFWFGLLLLVIFRRLFQRDRSRVKRQIESVGNDVDLDIDVKEYWLQTFIVGHIGSFLYRMHRLRAIRSAVGLDDDGALERTYKQAELTQATYLRAWIWLVFLSLIPALALPSDVPYSWVVAYPILGNVVLGPTLVIYDLRQIRGAKIQWGWTRLFFILTSPLFLALPLYMLHRKEHVQYRFIYDQLLNNQSRDLAAGKPLS